MKKGILILFVLCAIQLSVQAQDKNGTQKAKPTTTAENVRPAAETAAMMKENISKTVLHQNLSTQFGANYSLDSKEVVAQLNKIIDDKKESPETRRYALRALYGSNYAAHINRIQE